MVAHTGGFCRAKSPTRIPLKVSWRELAEEREKMAEKYVYLRDLAKYLKRDRSTLKNRIDRMGGKVYRIRKVASGQDADAVTVEDAKRIMAAEQPAEETVQPEDIKNL